MSDPNRSFSAQEWEALGPNNGRNIVLQMRERANGRGHQDGRGRGRGRGRQHNERNVSATNETDRDVQFDDEVNPSDNTRNDRGGQSGRGFGHGVYGAGCS